MYPKTQTHTVRYELVQYFVLCSALSICPWCETGTQVCCHLVKCLFNVYWCWWFLFSFLVKMQYCTCYLLSELGFKIRYQTNKYFKWVCVSNVLSQNTFFSFQIIQLKLCICTIINQLVLKHWFKVILQCIVHLARKHFPQMEIAD